MWGRGAARELAPLFQPLYGKIGEEHFTTMGARAVIHIVEDSIQ